MKIARLLVRYIWCHCVSPVIFTSGSGYDYSNVDQSVFEEMIGAESVGAYFQGIRNSYQFNRLSRIEGQDFLVAAIAQSDNARLTIVI